MSRVKFILFILCLFSIRAIYGQSVVSQARAYRNYQDFIDDKASYEGEFRFTPHYATKDHPEYKVKAVKPKVGNKELKYGTDYIKSGEYLYVNGARHGLNCGFLRFKSGVKYCYFTAMPSATYADDQRVINSGLIFGLAGAAATSAIIEKEKKDQVHHIFVAESARILPLCKEFVQYFLRDYPALARKFELEENKDDVDVLKIYLEKLDVLKSSLGN